jgi:hypothetical protein
MTSEIVRARLEAMGPWAAEWYEERSAIKEYEGGVGRAVAESEAWREVLEESERRRSSEGSPGA